MANALQQLRIDAASLENLVHMGTGTTDLCSKPRHAIPLLLQFLLNVFSYVHPSRSFRQASPYLTRNHKKSVGTILATYPSLQAFALPIK